jgi:hypothetical protein
VGRHRVLHPVSGRLKELFRLFCGVKTRLRLRC